MKKENKTHFPLTMNVSLNDAKMWATPKTFSPSLTAGPSVTFSSFGSLVLFFDYKTIHAQIKQNKTSHISIFLIFLKG